VSTDYFCGFVYISQSDNWTNAYIVP